MKKKLKETQVNKTKEKYSERKKTENQRQIQKQRKN